MDTRRFSEVHEMRGPRGEPVRVIVQFERFADGAMNYWHSAQTEGGQIVEPWKDGTFQTGDGTILTAADMPPFDRNLPID